MSVNHFTPSHSLSHILSLPFTPSHTLTLSLPQGPGERVLRPLTYPLTPSPSPSRRDLESVSSVLTWRLSAWPGGLLDRDADNANYSCVSSANAAGPGVQATTYFRVECEC